MENIENYNNFSRGEIRKKADKLLDLLHAAYLKNVAYDNREDIKKRLDDVKNSEIDWDKDVVMSVKNKFNILTSQSVINKHLMRSNKDFE